MTWKVKLSTDLPLSDTVFSSGGSDNEDGEEYNVVEAEGCGGVIVLIFMHNSFYKTNQNQYYSIFTF